MRVTHSWFCWTVWLRWSSVNVRAAIVMAVVSSSAQALAVSRQELETAFSKICNRTLGSSSSLTTLRVSKCLHFCVRAVTAEGLSEHQPSPISPISIRSWQLWNQILGGLVWFSICVDIFMFFNLHTGTCGFSSMLHVGVKFPRNT